MTEKDYQPFDFRSASTSDETVTSLRTWLMKTSTTFLESWESVSSTTVSLECRNVLSRTFEQCLDSIRTESVGCGIKLGEESVSTMAWVSCRELVSAIGCVIGTGVVEDAKDRKLTSIEESLCEMLFETLASSLSNSWPGVKRLPVVVSDQLDDMPQRSRMVKPKELMLVTKLEIKIDDATAMITWLVPREQAEKLLESISGASPVKSINRPDELVRQLQLEMVGVLGKVEMSMGELSDLKVGDLLVLEQKIDQPVVLNIDEHPHYRCWPGRIGNRQGLEIAEVL